jgi:two-component sensor histidine kinase
VLPSEAATALAMVLTEVLQNAVEHGYDADATSPGVIVVSARRLVGRLHVVIEDDGRGLPVDFDTDRSTHLGLSIVRTLVESELGGLLEIGPAHGQTGARVSVDLPQD